MVDFYDMFSVETKKEPEVKPKKRDNHCKTEEELYNALFSYETMFHNSLLIKSDYHKSNFKTNYSVEADDDPFADLADGLDTDESLPDGGTNDDQFGDDVSFDSFEDSSDSIFGSDDWSEDGDSNSETKAKALEVSRSDLLNESYNLGSQVRAAIPKKIADLNNIIDYNIDIINKNLHRNSDKYLDDLLFVKESYEEIKKSVEEYLTIIDSKTFDDIFSDYVVFLSLIDKANLMYQNIVKQQ